MSLRDKTGPTDPDELIAGFPEAGFDSSLQALEVACAWILAGQPAGRTVSLSGQSYEAGGEQYRMIDLYYRNGIFRLPGPVAGLEALAARAGVPPARLTVLDEGGAVAIAGAGSGAISPLSPPQISPGALARFLDLVYREAFAIKLLPGLDSYNFCAEALAGSDRAH